MKVFDSIDVAGGLKSVGPSEKPITSSDLKNALSGVTSGKTFQFHCLRDKKVRF